MNENLFNTIPKPQQEVTILKKGIFLMEREEGIFNILLYTMNNFYVEVFFHKGSNRVSWLNTFASTDDLDPYLEMIDISDLF